MQLRVCREMGIARVKELLGIGCRFCGARRGGGRGAWTVETVTREVGIGAVKENKAQGKVGVLMLTRNIEGYESKWLNS